MTRMISARAAAIAMLAWAGSLTAHHSLAPFDTDTPVRVKGALVAFELMNPHSRIFMDQQWEDGRVRRWVVDGPGVNQLARMDVTADMLHAGDVIEVCGFTLREPRQPLPEPASLDLDSSAPILAGEFMNGHVLVMPDGQKRLWSDYGQLEKCLEPGETRDSLIR